MARVPTAAKIAQVRPTDVSKGPTVSPDSFGVQASQALEGAAQAGAKGVLKVRQDLAEKKKKEEERKEREKKKEPKPEASKPKPEAPNPSPTEIDPEPDIIEVRGGEKHQMQAAQARVAVRRDTVERARAISAFGDAAGRELQRLANEEDLSSEVPLQSFGDFLATEQSKLIGTHPGSEDSRLQLAEKLESLRFDFADQAAALSVAAQRDLVDATVVGRINELVGVAGRSPASLPALFETLDEDIDDFAPAMAPADEIASRAFGREQIAAAAIGSFLDRGEVREAKRVLAEQPGLLRNLDPKTHRRIAGRIQAFDDAEVTATAAATVRRRQFREILGHEPSPQDRLRLAAIPPFDVSQTSAERLAAVEFALERPLTAEQRQRLLGSGPQLTGPSARLRQSRPIVAEEFGTDSLQAQALEEALAAGDAPPNLADSVGQRREFTKLSSNFVAARNAFRFLAGASAMSSPTGDAAMLASFTKLLSTGLDVADGELGRQAMDGVLGPEIQGATRQVLSGGRLTEEQRQGLIAVSQVLFLGQVQAQLRHEAVFRDLAAQANLDPDDVVIDFLGPFRSAIAPSRGRQSTLLTNAQPLPERSAGDVQDNTQRTRNA